MGVRWGVGVMGRGVINATKTQIATSQWIS
jgi:hypothetical protein